MMITMNEVTLSCSSPLEVLNNNILTILKELTSDHEAWAKFLSMVVKRFNSIGFGDELLTSCSANLCALMIIFNGEEMAVDYMKALTFSTCYSVSLLSQKIYIHNIGSEHALLEINKAYESDPNFRFSADYAINTSKIKECWANFTQEIQQGKRKDAEDILEVNGNVIRALSNDIQCNERLIHETESFVYQVMIRAPTIDFQNVLNTEDLFHKCLLACYHCFVIEQYCSPSGEIRYILYNTWTGKFSLADHLKSKSYDGSGSMNREELNQFFDFLVKLLVQHKTKGEEKLLQEAEFNCFGVKNESVSSAIAFNSNIMAFSGKSIRYITTKVTPISCRMNYKKFISNNY
jgi:hypothetical protein